MSLAVRKEKKKNEEDAIQYVNACLYFILGTHVLRINGRRALLPP